MDRRIKYTKQIIKDTFIDLLSDKEINKVTVSEICKLADINRATFYRYYLDVFDLLDKIEEEFVTELREAYAVFDNDDYELSHYAKALLEICLENRKLVKILFNTKNNIDFMIDVLEEAYSRCKEKWYKDNSNLDEKDANYAAVYIFNGAIGIVNYWVQNDFYEDVDEVAKIIQDMSYYGIKRFIYKK